MDKLLNCPFCGGEAELNSEDTPIKKGEGHYNYDFVAVFQIHCVECNFVCSNFFEKKEDAIKAWNKRAEPKGEVGEKLNLHDLDKILPGWEEMSKAVLMKKTIQALCHLKPLKKIDEGELKEVNKVVCKSKKQGGKFFYPIANVDKNSYLVGWINGACEFKKAITSTFGTREIKLPEKILPETRIAEPLCEISFNKGRVVGYNQSIDQCQQAIKRSG